MIHLMDEPKSFLRMRDFIVVGRCYTAYLFPDYGVGFTLFQVFNQGWFMGFEQRNYFVVQGLF